MPRRVIITVGSSAEIPGVIQQQVEATKRDIAGFDYSRVFRSEIVPWLRRVHGDYFKTGSGPEGAWKPLRPYTVLKKGHSEILIETGRLIGSLTNPSSPDALANIGARTLEYGTKVPYSKFHMTGFRLVIGRRKTKPTPESLFKSATKINVYRDFKQKQPKFPKGALRVAGVRDVPPRKHVGLSPAKTNELAERIATALVESLTGS